jgi:hypothetical protein
LGFEVAVLWNSAFISAGGYHHHIGQHGTVGPAPQAAVLSYRNFTRQERSGCCLKKLIEANFFNRSPIMVFQKQFI